MSDKYIEKISQTLKDMEERGDIVITTTTPKNLSNEIFCSIVKSWIDENTEIEEPIEFTLPNILEEIIKTTSYIFNITIEDAHKIVVEYNNYRLKHWSPKENAELYWHQGKLDISLRAYYRVKLGKEDSSVEFLDWRKRYHDKKL